MPRLNKPMLRRVTNGVEEFFCRRCESWKVRESFAVMKDHIWGLTSPCKLCHAERVTARRHANIEAYRARARELYRREREAEKAAEEELAMLHRPSRRNDNQARDRVPSEVVTRWMDEATAEDRGDRLTIDQIAAGSGVSVRRLYIIRTGQQKNVQHETAEKVAFITGHIDELREMFPPLGVDGWGPHGERHCQRCGTWTRRHRGRGYCKGCYQVVRWHEKLGHRVPPPRAERWQVHFDECQRCHSSAKGHVSRGLCVSCYHGMRREADSAKVYFPDYLTLHGYLPIVPSIAARRRQQTESSRCPD